MLKSFILSTFLSVGLIDGNSQCSSCNGTTVCDQVAECTGWCQAGQGSWDLNECEHSGVVQHYADHAPIVPTNPGCPWNDSIPTTVPSIGVRMFIGHQPSNFHTSPYLESLGIQSMITEYWTQDICHCVVPHSLGDMARLSSQNIINFPSDSVDYIRRITYDYDCIETFPPSPPPPPGPCGSCHASNICTNSSECTGWCRAEHGSWDLTQCEDTYGVVQHTGLASSTSAGGCPWNETWNTGTPSIGVRRIVKHPSEFRRSPLLLSMDMEVVET